MIEAQHNFGFLRFMDVDSLELISFIYSRSMAGPLAQRELIYFEHIKMTSLQDAITTFRQKGGKLNKCFNFKMFQK